MRISTIPITLRNGRVRARAREYWRLLIPNKDKLQEGDECRGLGNSWRLSKWQLSQHVLDNGTLLYRRRVTAKGAK